MAFGFVKGKLSGAKRQAFGRQKVSSGKTVIFDTPCPQPCDHAPQALTFWIFTFIFRPEVMT